MIQVPKLLVTVVKYRYTDNFACSNLTVYFNFFEHAHNCATQFKKKKIVVHILVCTVNILFKFMRVITYLLCTIFLNPYCLHLVLD